MLSTVARIHLCFSSLAGCSSVIRRVVIPAWEWLDAIARVGAGASNLDGMEMEIGTGIGVSRSAVVFQGHGDVNHRQYQCLPFSGGLSKRVQTLHPSDS